MLSLALCVSFSATIVASSDGDISKQVAGRLVDENGQITDKLKQILDCTGVKPADDTLSAAVEVTQKTWRKNDWKFPKTLENVKNRDALKEALSGLMVVKTGKVVPNVVTQGGGFCTMLQILCALNQVVLKHKLKRITCFVPGFPLDENGIKDYKALLEIVGNDPKHAKELQQEVEAKTLDRKTLIAWIRKHVYPALNNVSIELLPAREMSEWAKKHPGDVTLVAPPEQAANHCASMRARCPELNIVGLRAISELAAGVLGKFYRRASTEDQKLGAQLNLLAGELFFIQKARVKK